MVKHSVACIVLGVMLGALLVGAGIMDVRDAQATGGREVKAQPTRSGVQALKQQALKGCAVRVLFEDGSGTPERDDTTRRDCQAYVQALAAQVEQGQVGHAPRSVEARVSRLEREVSDLLEIAYWTCGFESNRHARLACREYVGGIAQAAR